jgi:O-antigen/teichoic acid export membrane protein
MIAVRTLVAELAALMGAAGGLRSWLGRRAGAAVRQGMTTIADQGVVSMTNFLTGVIVARCCSRAELGLYSLGFSVVLLLTSAQTYLVSVPYNVYCMRVPAGERSAYTGSTLVHQMVMSVAAVALLGSVLLLLSPGAGVQGFGPVLSMLALTIAFTLAREYGRQLFFSRLRFASVLLLDIAVAVLQLAALLWLAHVGRLSARAAFAVTGATSAVAVLLWVLPARRLVELVPGRVLAAFQMNWVIGRWSLAAGLATVAGTLLYPWFIAASRGADQAGTLAACTGITALTNPLVIGMGNFLAPRITHAFAEGGAGAVQRVTRAALLAFGAIMSFMCPALFLGGGELLKLVYGARYAGHGLTVGLLSLALVADWLSLPAHHALLLMERADVTFKSNLIEVLVTVTLGFALVTELGAIGAAIGLLVGHSLATLFKWREYRKGMGSWLPGDVVIAGPASGTGS